MRCRLPDRRAASTFEFSIGGLRYTATFGFHADGGLGEIFLNGHKAGSAADTAARDASIAASLALQFGCPLGVLQHALPRDAQGRASSPLSAALDLLASELRKATR